MVALKNNLCIRDEMGRPDVGWCIDFVCHGKVQKAIVDDLVTSGGAGGNMKVFSMFGIDYDSPVCGLWDICGGDMGKILCELEREYGCDIAGKLVYDFEHFASGV
jgi:hypothetical protein